MRRAATAGESVRALRRAGLIGAAVGLLLNATPAVPLAATTGVIKGVVINQSTGEPQPGAEVTLLGALSDGSEPSQEKVTTDPEGRYRFADLPTGSDRFYALDVVHDGGLFSGRAITLPDDTDERPVFDTEVRVWDTTTEPTAILMARTNLFLSRGDDGTMDVIESVRVNNLSDLAYIGRGMADGGTGDGSTPSLGFALPNGSTKGGVEIFDSSLELSGLVETDFGFGITAAIPPGETSITFRYRVVGSTGSYNLSRTAVYDIVQFSVHAPEGFDVRSNRLQPDGNVTVGGIDYTRWSSEEAIEAGNQIQMVSVQAATGTSGLAGWIIGAVAALVILMALGIGWSVRKRGRRSKTTRPRPTRTDLLTQIAELDVRRDRGEITEDDWARLRRELKERAGALPKDEVAR